MDQPSAQSVGREFVRQYYTMLHEAPDYLHRFYSHNSSFVHGGVERPGEEQAPAIGQAEIHKKIASLEFRDCHAKIRQVDSQASVEGSVVIQVVGELSNGGSPMRRFMQTFVLAPQSPKKYYLHNDIFRYQDEVFHEPGVGEVDGQSAVEEHDENEFTEDVLEIQHVQQQHQVITDQEHKLSEYYDQSSVLPLVPTAVSNGGESYDEMASNQDSGAVEQEANEEHASSADPPSVVETPSIIRQDNAVSSTDIGASDTTAKVTAESKGDGAEEALRVNDDTRMTDSGMIIVPSSVEKPVQDQPAVPAQKPTWAAMASRNMSVATPTGAVVGYAPKPQATIRPEPNSVEQRMPVSNGGGGGLPQRTGMRTVGSSEGLSGRDGSTPSSAQTPRGNVEGIPRSSGIENGGRGGNGGLEGGRGGIGGEGGDENGRRFPPQPVYPDNQQVFVGNVPQHVTDLELKEYFEQYGTVVDIRINRKTNNNVPNFGFISYDSPVAVQKILTSRPLPKLYNKHRLNVEEKKPKEELIGRPRSSGGPRSSLSGGSTKPSYVGGRDAYISSSGGSRGRGGYNNGGSGEEGSQNGGGSYHGVNHPPPGAVVRNYTGSCSSDDGRGGVLPPAASSTVTAAASPSAQH